MVVQNRHTFFEPKQLRKPRAYVGLTLWLRLAYVRAYALAYVASPGRP